MNTLQELQTKQKKLLFNIIDNIKSRIILYPNQHVEELENIGYGEYVGGEGLTLIEWADNFLEEMPEESLDIYIKIVPEGRLIQLLPNGERYLELCEEVEKNADFSH